MTEVVIYLTNSPILTGQDGTIEVRTVSKAEVVRWLTQYEFVSAIGHPGTAAFLSRILGITIPCERVSIQQGKSDIVIAFSLLTRLEEGRLLTDEELVSVPYTFRMIAYAGAIKQIGINEWWQAIAPINKYHPTGIIQLTRPMLLTGNKFLSLNTIGDSIVSIERRETELIVKFVRDNDRPGAKGALLNHEKRLSYVEYEE